MVVVMQACKLNLPHSRPSLEVTSLLFEPSSNTLALMHSDSSILLLPSLSPFSPSSPSTLTQTLIPPLSTSSCFLRLQSTLNSSNNRILFVVAGPRHGDSRVLLRFWILLKSTLFIKAKVNCSQSCFVCDDKLGVLIDLSHGVSVKLAGSVNVFALHSISARKIWIFSAKMVGDEEGSVSVKLMKCAVIDCTIPISSITASLGFLVLGECNGVRVFSLRVILKGRMRKERDSARRKEKKNALQNREACLENGACRLISGSNFTSAIHSKCVDRGHTGKSTVLKEPADMPSNGYTGKAETNNAPSKLRTVKLKQDSSVSGTFFVAFNSLEVSCQESRTKPLLSLRAVSVHSLSQKKFLVLDSDGDLHLMGLYSTNSGSEITGHMRHIGHTMKVRMLAVLPDISTRTHTFWISDGINSVHVMSVSDMDVSLNERVKSENDEKQMQISAIQALFTSEKIQDLISLSANANLILGQGNIYAYSIS